jgi:predicted nucleotidyltransferase component of viral defense system
VIPEAFVTAWAVEHPWARMVQVEQDLLLSRALCAIATHPNLRDELVFRGGTALHKLHLPAARRYSEDLDYVRRSQGAIGPMMRALCDLGADLGSASRPGSASDRR